MSIKATQPEDSAVTDEQILALNADERFFSESPTKYPESGHGTQYHAGAPGVIGFARAVIALATPSPQPATTKEADEAEPERELCPYCDGTGESTVMSDGGPDAYDVQVCCPHCDGNQTLTAAYAGVLKLLDREKKKYRECAAILYTGRANPSAAKRLEEIAEYLAKPKFDAAWVRDRLLALADMARVTQPSPPQPAEAKTAAVDGMTGWSLVPVEPTDDMEAAAEDDYEAKGETFPDWKSKWRAMISAAPKPPATPAVDGVTDEPFGYVLHWPSGDKNGKLLFSETRTAGDAIGCPVTPVYTRLHRRSGMVDPSLMPEPAFRLKWNRMYGEYRVNKANIGDTDCYTAEQLRAAIDAAIATQEGGHD